MKATWLLLIALAMSPPSDGDGREGNDYFREGRYREAADAYLAALDALGPDAAADVQASLLNNLGASLYRIEDYETALQAFVRSLSVADTPADRSRAAYNAGNAAYRQDNLNAALSFFKQALLEDGLNDSARYNFEFVRRRVKDDQPQQQEDSGGKIEPSEYAKALKRQAEELVAKRQYRLAHGLMLDGLRVDETVRAFQDFIGRTGNISDIDQPQDS